MKNEWKISQIAAGFGSAVTSVSLCLMHAGVHVNALPPGSVSSTAGAKRGARRGGSQPSPRPPPSGGLGLSSELTQQIKVQGGRWRSEAPSHPPPPTGSSVPEGQVFLSAAQKVPVGKRGR